MADVTMEARRGFASNPPMWNMELQKVLKITLQANAICRCEGNSSWGCVEEGGFKENNFQTNAIGRFEANFLCVVK